jgi:hypothetical protein
MNTISKLIGVAFSGAILFGAVALADGTNLGQAATVLAAGSEGAAVVALVNSGDSSSVAQPVQVATAQSSYAGQSALLRAPSAPHPSR